MEVQEVFVVLTLSVFNICWGVMASLPAPLFPIEASEKGATGSQISPVLGTMYPGLFFTSFLVPILVNRFGLYSVFLIGILVASLSAVLFGTITFVSQLGLFLVFAYLVRFIEGVSMAVLWSTVLAILLATYPTRPAAVYSLLDTTFGLGLSLGPVLGSLLFSFSGFLLPFLACGGAILTTGLLSLPQIGPLTSAAEKHITSGLPSPRPLFSSPSLLTALLTTSTVAFSAYGYMMPLLELHLSSLNLSTTSIGFCFLTFSATYTVVTILCGLVSDSYIQPWTICLTGLSSLFLSFVVLGPSPFLPLPSTMLFKLVGLVLQGIGTGCVLVASYSCALKATLQLPEFPEDVTTYSLVSSLWTAAYALGSFLGTSLAGLLYDNLGWRWGCATVQCLLLVTIAFSLRAAVSVAKQNNYKELEGSNKEDRVGNGDGNYKLELKQ